MSKSGEACVLKDWADKAIDDKAICLRFQSTETRNPFCCFKDFVYSPHIF